MSKKKPVRIYELYEGKITPSNLYIDPETGLVVVIKDDVQGVSEGEKG